MGIPSYFKHILNRYPHLLEPVRPEFRSDILLVDFNCLIYGCIRGPNMPPYTAATRAEWESAALREIQTYVVHIWNSAGRPADVYLAVDGVVPMAKIKQQRLRRFKSVWLAAREREQGVRAPGAEFWDTNAITPGTEFMEKLATALRTLCAKRPGWVVSAADEPGEGEQKAMTWVREHVPQKGKRICVYGLDADLILLCLYHATAVAPDADWSVFREQMEFGGGGGVTGSSGSEFLTLNIQGLATALWPDPSKRVQQVLTYMCGMSLLGNDFLPHSLGVHIRGGGHDRLLAALSRDATGSPLVARDENGQLRVDRGALLAILEEWAQTEEQDILETFRRKYSGRGPPPRTDTERKMLPVQNLPLEWAAEQTLWPKGSPGLYEGWQRAYYSASVCQADIERRCEVWCEGLQWILDYYTGQAPVSQRWFYPWTHPPLWADLATYVRSRGHLPTPPAATEQPLQPQEQLSLVLPLESWGLVREARLCALPARLPAYWPESFGFESLGKRWLWECEPALPILVPGRLTGEASLMEAQ